MPKLILTLIICFIFHSIPAHTTSLEISIFNKLRQEYYENSPKDYIARITGPQINESLKEIPKEVYCKDKNKLPKVSYIFIKGEEEGIIVEDVENPYINRFQSYVEIYKKTKWFLESQKSFDELKHILHWEIIKEDSREYIIKTRKKRFRKTDFLILHIKKSNYKIRKAIQYSNNKDIGRLLITYKKINVYTLPYKLFFFKREKGKVTSFSLQLSDYRSNLELDSNILVNLQDDCPSLEEYY